MSINLSDLTSPNNQDIFTEITSGVDFLDPIGRLKNLSRSSNAGGDALQTTALNQPKALPLTKDANGVLGGYLYQPDVTGNAPAVDIPSISANEDFVFEMEVYLVDATSFHLASGADANNRFGIYNNAFYFSPENVGLSSPLSTGASTLTVERSGTTATLKQDGVVKATLVANIADNTYTFTHLSFNGQFGTSIGRINGYIKKATLSIEGTQVFNCDFTANHVRHNDLKIKCSTGQIVTINQDSSSSNDVATIIKRPVLRFDGANNGLQGIFDNNIDGGYMFAAFSVLGSGGEAWGRIFSTNSSGGGEDDREPGAAFSIRNSSTTNLHTRFKLATASLIHVGMFDNANGDILHESKIQNGSQSSKINNADLKTESHTITTASDEFNIGSYLNPSLANTAIDLQYLALFPATITDEQADLCREYIRGKTQVYDLPTAIKNDYSVLFDGTDDYMSMTLPVLGNTHTLSAWFKTTASYGGPGSEGTLISYISSGGGGDDSVLSVITNKVGWSDFVDDDQYGTSTVNDGNWHHAVAVVTATTQKIYVDGVLETTTTNAYSAGTNFSSATIGRRASASQRFFNGNIDEVAIWDNALTANEVKSIYNDGKPVDLSGQPELYSSANNLVAWWRMGDNNSGTGATVTDNSMNSYNGTLINGPIFQTNTP